MQVRGCNRALLETSFAARKYRGYDHAISQIPATQTFAHLPHPSVLVYLQGAKCNAYPHASAHLLGDTSDIVIINVVLKGERTGGCNRPLWSLCVCPTLCTCALVPSWCTAATPPATRRAACNMAALAAAGWAGFEPRARLRLLLRCRRAGWLPLRWCTPRAFTRKSLAKHVSRFVRL